MTALLRVALVLAAVATVPLAGWPTRGPLATWRAVAGAASALAAADPAPPDLDRAAALLDTAAAAEAPPAIAAALRAKLALHRGDPAAAREAAGAYARADGPLAGAVRRYLAGPADPPAPAADRHEPLVRVLDGWRLAFRGDPDELGRLLASRRDGQRVGFHQSYLEFLRHVLAHPRDLDGAKQRLDPLRRMAATPDAPDLLGLGPDPFDPVVRADATGTLRLEPSPWRGELALAPDSVRRRRVDMTFALANIYAAQGRHHRALFQAEVLAKNSAAEIEARGLRPQLDRLLYPRPHRERVEALAAEHRLDPWLVYAVAREESKWDPEAGSSVGAVGLMQVMPDTASWITKSRGKARRVGVRELQRPADNLGFGAWYLRYLADKFVDKKTRWRWALAAYNGGIGNASRWLKAWKKRRKTAPETRPEDVITFPETRAYVTKVTASQAEYRRLYGAS